MIKKCVKRGERGKIRRKKITISQHIVRLLLRDESEKILRELGKSDEHHFLFNRNSEDVLACVYREKTSTTSNLSQHRMYFSYYKENSFAVFSSHFPCHF